MPFKDPETKRAWRQANRAKQREYNARHRASLSDEEKKAANRRKHERDKERERAKRAEFETTASDYDRALAHIMRHHFSSLTRIVAEWEREALPEVHQARLDRKRATRREIDRRRKRDPIQCRAKRHAYEARKASNGGEYTAADIDALHHEQHGQCAYCAAPWEHIDHMHPVSRGGSNWPSNLQLLCAHHNTSKGALTDGEYRSRMGWPPIGKPMPDDDVPIAA